MPTRIPRTSNADSASESRARIQVEFQRRTHHGKTDQAEPGRKPAPRSRCYSKALPAERNAAKRRGKAIKRITVIARTFKILYRPFNSPLETASAASAVPSLKIKRRRESYREQCSERRPCIFRGFCAGCGVLRRAGTAAAGKPPGQMRRAAQASSKDDIFQDTRPTLKQSRSLNRYRTARSVRYRQAPPEHRSQAHFGTRKRRCCDLPQDLCCFRILPGAAHAKPLSRRSRSLPYTKD